MHLVPLKLPTRVKYIDHAPSIGIPWIVRTRVWTMSTLLSRRLTRNSYTLMLFCSLIRSSMESKRIKVPVLPTPALQCTTRGTPLSLLWAFWTLRRNEMREVANLGTPWSGQEVKWYWVTASGCSSDWVVYKLQALYNITQQRKADVVL